MVNGVEEVRACSEGRVDHHVGPLRLCCAAVYPFGHLNLFLELHMLLEQRENVNMRMLDPCTK